MISQREVERKYMKLMHDVETNDFYKVDLTKRVNCYTCQKCFNVTKTIDIDAGVTPFIIGCEICGSDCYSSFYNDTHRHINPTFEWYRPSLPETLKQRKNVNTIDHILQGGLLKRKIVTTNPQ